MLCKNKERYVWEIMDPCLKKMLKENVETKKKTKKAITNKSIVQKYYGTNKTMKKQPKPESHFRLHWILYI